MSDQQPKRRTQRSEDVADLFRVLRFMSADSDVKEAHFRIAFRIAQFAHAKTCVAKVSDDTLMDHLPRTDDKKLRVFRRSLEALGWIRTVEGARGRPTRYVFLETRIPAIEKRLSDAAAKREAEFALRKSQELSGAKAMALRARIDAETGEIRDELPVEYDLPIDPEKAGNLRLNKGAILPPLLPQRSTYKTGYRVENVTQDARAHLPASAPVPARTDLPPPPPMNDDEDDPIAATGEFVRADVLAWKLPLLESGRFACFDCGAETQLAARYKSERYCPFCPDCIETGEFPDVKLIPCPKSYAEASEGE